MNGPLVRCHFLRASQIQNCVSHVYRISGVIGNKYDGNNTIHVQTLSKVVYMCSSLLQLAPGSRDLSQAEKRMIVM